jgi:hypothetical protein
VAHADTEVVGCTAAHHNGDGTHHMLDRHPKPLQSQTGWSTAYIASEVESDAVEDGDTDDTVVDVSAAVATNIA